MVLVVLSVVFVVVVVGGVHGFVVDGVTDVCDVDGIAMVWWPLMYVVGGWLCC